MIDTNKFDKKNVRGWMLLHCHEYLDSIGVLNFTSLAEAAANAFDKADDGGPLDDETHWIWDLPFDVESIINEQ